MDLRRIIWTSYYILINNKQFSSSLCFQLTKASPRHFFHTNLKFEHALSSVFLRKMSFVLLLFHTLLNSNNVGFIGICILVKAFSSGSPSKIFSCILHCIAILSQYEEQQYRCHCYPSTVNLVNVSILHTSLPLK